jgi:hypothetical protein
MLHGVVVSFNFWEQLSEIDERTAARVAASGCPRCGGPLHRSDYPRKPRGGWIAAIAEGAVRRASLCCGREGCRKRALPPSVRFLGRKVYVGAAIAVACAVAQLATVAEAGRTSGIPGRTVNRWLDWWQSDYPQSRHFQEARSRLMPPVDVSRLPVSLWERFAAHAREVHDALVNLLAFVAPITTASVPDGSRFVRVR